MKLKPLQKRKVFKQNKSKFIKKMILFALFLAVLSTGVYFSYRLIDSKINNGNSLINLKSKWKIYDFQSVYDISSAILYTKPFNTTARTYNGCAAFFLAVSKPDLTESLNLLDESINSLRIALQNAKFGSVSQIEYMLGKAYFYKNHYSSYHYYADLAVKYLLKAKKHGYKPKNQKNNDIPYLLGLSYASLGMTTESLSAFTEALLIRETDDLLLSIAEQYLALGQDIAAEQYLFRISQECKNEQIVLRSHILHGNIFIGREQYDDAEKEFNFVLEKDENYVDALNGMKLVYEARGDKAKARAEQRKALRIQNNQTSALKKNE